MRYGNYLYKTGNYTPEMIQAVLVWLTSEQTEVIGAISTKQDSFRVRFQNGREWTYYVSTILDRIEFKQNGGAV